MQILYENKIEDTLIFQANKETVKEINLHLLKKNHKMYFRLSI